MIGLAAALASGCYESPEDYPAEKVLCLSVSRGEIDDGQDDAEDLCPGGTEVFAADGVGVADLTISFPSGSSEGVEVVVTTTLGVLDPTGATEADRRRKKFTIGRGPAVVQLYAGLESGVALVTANVGNARAEKRVALVPSMPTTVALAASIYVLSESATGSDLTTSLLVEGEKRRPSSGIDVGLLACEGATSSDKVELVPTVRTDGTSDRVGTRLGLNAAGLAEVNRVAVPGEPEVAVTVHAFVPGGAGVGCDTIGEVTPRDSVALVLRRKSM